MDKAGLTPFRLCDVPLADRMRGKDVALRAEQDMIMRLRIGLAAEKPSSTVYWIPTRAWDRVMRR